MTGEAEPQLLEGKVVVLSGVGPGLGRSLGEEAARLGADLVLASRTRQRLDKMAEVVRSDAGLSSYPPTSTTRRRAGRWWTRPWRSTAGSTA